MQYAVRHLLNLYDMKAEQMMGILANADQHLLSLRNTIPHGHTLENHCVAVLCWPIKSKGISIDLITPYDSYIVESFSSAAESLGAVTTSTIPDPDERLKDIILSVKAIIEQWPEKSLTTLVIRHNKEGIPHQIAELDLVKGSGIAVINGGDGNHENPTEALAYMYQIFRMYRRIAGLRILIVGDISFDPLTRALVFGLSRIGADVHIVAPSGLVPKEFPPGILVTVHNNYSTVIQVADVIILAPVGQYAFEQGILPSREEYLCLSPSSRPRFEKNKVDIFYRPKCTSAGVR